MIVVAGLSGDVPQQVIDPRIGRVTGISPAEIAPLDRYWRAANYLSVGQIYLLDNPLLREPLRPEHIKPRLLGHFGTTPGLNLMYVHLNRAIRERQLDAIFVTGPGHGGPANVAQAYLEGTYSERYADIGQNVDGMTLCKVFSVKTIFSVSSMGGGG